VRKLRQKKKKRGGEKKKDGTDVKKREGRLREFKSLVVKGKS